MEIGGRFFNLELFSSVKVRADDYGCVYLYTKDNLQTPCIKWLCDSIEEADKFLLYCNSVWNKNKEEK